MSKRLPRLVIAQPWRSQAVSSLRPSLLSELVLRSAAKLAPTHDSPAPNPAHEMTSPFFTLPLRTASSSASGMLTALVFPYVCRFVMTFSLGSPPP